MQLRYAVKHDLLALHDELLRIPALAPKMRQDGVLEASFSLSGDGETISLYVPDGLTPDQLAQIEQVIMAHKPPDLEAVKVKRIADVKREAHALLAPTDWLIIRQQEIGKPIPQAVLDYRAAVRAAADRAEQEIAELDSVEAVRAYRVEWPEKPAGVP